MDLLGGDYFRSREMSYILLSRWPRVVDSNGCFRISVYTAWMYVLGQCFAKGG